MQIDNFKVITSTIYLLIILPSDNALYMHAHVPVRHTSDRYPLTSITAAVVSLLSLKPTISYFDITFLEADQRIANRCMRACTRTYTYLFLL